MHLSAATEKEFHAHVLQMRSGREVALPLLCPSCATGKLVLTWTVEDEGSCKAYYFKAQCQSCQAEYRTDPGHDRRATMRRR